MGGERWNEKIQSGEEKQDSETEQILQTVARHRQLHYVAEGNSLRCCFVYYLRLWLQQMIDLAVDYFLY